MSESEEQANAKRLLIDGWLDKNHQPKSSSTSPK